jgi:hypothetical protein
LSCKKEFVSDAISTVRNSIGDEELIGLVNDSEKAKKIISVKSDIFRYLYFSESKEMGIFYGPSDMSFTDMMLFTWIKDGLGGRKT